MKTNLILAGRADRTLAAMMGFAVCWVHAQVAPTIPTNGEPKDVSVSVGAMARFTVGVSGTGPVVYQWYAGDTPIPWGTLNFLTVTNVQLSDHGGVYRAVATTEWGAVTSRWARLEIDPTFEWMSPLAGDTDSFLPYWVDTDRDGWLDLVVSGGWNTLGGKRLMVFDNKGGGRLERNTTNDLARVTLRGFGMAWGDYDGDGDLDAYLGCNEEDLASYLRNEGGGRFTRITTDQYWAVNGVSVRGSAPAAGDYDRDGLLDLVVGYFGNMGGSWGTNQLLHGTMAGRFEWVAASPLKMTRTWPETVAWVDYNDDGELDLFCCTSGDAGQKDYMFRGLGNGGFERVTNSVLVQIPSVTIGQAWGDYDNDGDLDVLLSNWSETQWLYENLGDGRFYPDVRGPVGRVGENSEVAGWADYDNDGWLDLFMVQYNGLSRMFHNRGDGTLEEVLTGSPVAEAKGYGMAWGDYDNDGFQDLVVVDSVRAKNWLYRNYLKQVGNTNHWLKIKLVGNASNRDGIGATVRVKATIGGKTFWQRRQIVSQTHEFSLIAHFGLGDASVAEVVRIEWPSGNITEILDVVADGLRTFSEPRLITPFNPSVSLGGSVQLSSIGGLAYEWLYQGVPIPGATNRTLTLTNIAAADAGRYSVAVTSSGSEGPVVQTNHVYVRVDTQFTKVMDSPLVATTEAAWACSWVDYDDDGDIDLFVANGPEAATPERNGMYRNDGAAGFVRLTNEVGSLVADLGRYGGGMWADYDNDGDVDCLMTDWTLPYPRARNALHRNLGNGVFVKVAPAPDQLSELTIGYVLWADYDNDGWLDVFDGQAWSDAGVLTNKLLHSVGAGAFERITQGRPVTDRYVGLEGAAWGDYDGDGDPDLIVADTHAFWRNGTAPNHLYRNDGSGVFTKILTNAIATDRASSLVPMWADYDNDGKLDLFMSCYSDTSRLFHNEGNGVFTRILLGPGQETAQPAWGDFDNDGDLDLYIARGQGTPNVNLFYLNNGDGTFSQITSGSPAVDVARGGACVWGDYDNDGFLDLYMANNRGDRHCLYHNNGNRNHWLMVRLKATTSNGSAYGAKVRAFARVQGKLRWQMREMTGGIRCQNDPRAHFGLGPSTVVNTLRIEWPSGTVQELVNVPADQILTVVEPRRPVMTTELAADGWFRMQFATESGRTYELQVSEDLEHWTTVTTYTGTGDVIQFPDLPPLADRRFFRIVSALR